KLVTPRVVKKFLATGTDKAEELPIVFEKHRIIESDILRIIREGMRKTVTDGSARSFLSLPIEIAAKTGTAQFDVAKERTHSWFTSFAPYGKPEIAISVIVEGGGEGFSVAAPVAKNIYEKYFSLPITPITAAIIE
ncbi:MAG: penicillin-binding transpeptidase domain-containing protein, partial [Patescibacteria group bacterium]